MISDSDAPTETSTDAPYHWLAAFIGGLSEAQFDEAATREIITQAGTSKEKRFTGQSYLLNYGLPHFFFHTGTAYSILRHNGVEVGKKDYIGSY